MKNKLIVGTVLAGTLLIASPVEAMGNAKVEFTSFDNIQVGDTFTVNMSVTDVNDTYDGVVSLGGNLSFDSTMVEYVSSKEVDAPYQFQINEDYNYKLAGLDFTLDNGIREDVTVYEFTFKALQKGNTTITLTNAKLTDSKDYINTVILGSEITISEKEEVVSKEIINNEIEVVKLEENKEKVEEVKEVESKIEETIEKEEIKESKEDNKQTIESKNEFEVIEVVEEKETLVEKIQKIVSDFISNLRNLFK